MERSGPNKGNVLVFGMALAATVLAVASFVIVNVKFEPSTSAGGGATSATVTLSDFAISPEPIDVGEGGSLQLSNTGATEHNLEVEGQGVVSPNVAGGASASLDVSSLAAGSYVVFCNIAGHRDQGMEGTLNVGAGGGGGDSAASTDSGSMAEHDWEAADKAMEEGANEYVNAVVESIGAGEPSGVATEGRGNQILEPTVEADGTKVFELTASIIEWEVAPGKVVEAWAYNEMLPGPQIKVNKGDKVRIILQNDLPASTDIHFHGITTPFAADGVAPITQPMIRPGETYTYEFTAPDRDELGMYHPHNHGQIAVVNGMFAAFQVGEVPLPAGNTVNGETLPADLDPAQELPMVLNDAGTVGLSLNGKAFPATDPIVTGVGDWTVVHYFNEGLMPHPMHLHHMPQLVYAKDGIPLDSPYWADTINVAPGERYSVLVRTTEQDLNLTDPAAPAPGIWAFHCHILTHAENDQGLANMVTAWVVLPD